MAKLLTARTGDTLVSALALTRGKGAEKCNPAREEDGSIFLEMRYPRKLRPEAAYCCWSPSKTPFSQKKKAPKKIRTEDKELFEFFDARDLLVGSGNCIGAHDFSEGLRRLRACRHEEAIYVCSLP